MKANIPKGPSMNEMLRQAQKMQEDMQNKQAELEAREYEVSAGGGVVKVKINGKREIMNIDIGVNKSFLINEHNKAYESVTTPNCKEKCSGCGANKLGKELTWCPKKK